ncbi:MAG: hypothetical protein JO118_05750 [Acetobacteraceae bacterium]|nr:hypothetical protein [Acetobacteraceae bacterium]
MAGKSMPKADDVAEQVARLRAQVEALMQERVTPVLADAASRAETAIGSARHQAEAVSGRVKEQPFVAVLVAAAIGFLAARVLR